MKLSSIPVPPFRHLQRLTDTIGVIERANGVMPRYGQGYRVDNVAVTRQAGARHDVPRA